MVEEDEDKTAFFAGEGVYCYRKMPFSLKNARATYQRLLDKVFNDQIGINLEAYIDDMVIKSTSEEDMLTDKKETFQRFRSINMKLNPKKCSFGVEDGPFLGHLITKQGIRANPSKVKAITDTEQPKTLKDIQSLNGKLAALSRFMSKGTERKHKRSFICEKGRRTGSHLLHKQSPTGSRAQLPCTGKTHTSIGTRSEKAAKIILGRVAKWAIELGEHDIVFRARGDSNKETPKDFLIKAPPEDNRKEVKRKTDTELKETKLSCEWKLYTDGASSSDGSGAGLMLIDPKDSQLLVNQVKGIYTAKQPAIREYLQRTKETLRRFRSYTIEHIKRNQNKKADALSKLDSMTFEHLTKEKKYASEILEKAHMVNCNSSRTPVDTESKLRADSDPVSDSNLYRSLVSSLQYLTFTRSDISYAVEHVFLYMHDPREPHFSDFKRILSYVQGTLDYGMQLISSSTTNLVAYSNADWARCPTTQRSTLGYCVFLGNNLLSWSSKRQRTLSRSSRGEHDADCFCSPLRSSAEAEYRDVANAVAETCWLRNLLRELHTPLSSATLVYYDNVSAVYLSCNPVRHQRTKHIEIDIHFVRDLVVAGQVRVLHVSSRYQFANIFTKGLSSVLFEEFLSSLSVRCPPAQTTGEC
ncbi:ribonuclease H-like domain-containing protein [Tanacetum coccineum]